MVRRIFAFEGNGVVKQYEGGFTDYWQKVEASSEAVEKAAKENDEVKKSKKDYKSHEKKIKFTYAEQKEFETIDEDIEKLEEKLEQFDKEIAANAKDFVKLQELTKNKEETQRLLDEKMERWVYLNDLAEQIEAAKA